jgi:hypothetical protein
MFFYMISFFAPCGSYGLGTGCELHAPQLNKQTRAEGYKIAPIQHLSSFPHRHLELFNYLP